MEFKNFKIDYNWWENDRDLLIQHQNDLQKLDQLFEQFYEQNNVTDLLEWSINYQYKDNSFHLWQEYCGNILSIFTKQFDRLLNPLLFEKIVKTWTKYYGEICDQDEHWICYNLDTNEIDISRQVDYADFLYNYFSCTFVQSDFVKIYDLFQIYVIMANFFNVLVTKLDSNKSLQLQILKQVIDQGVSQIDTDEAKQLLKQCQNELSKPDCTILSFCKLIDKNEWLWCCNFKFDLFFNQVKFNFNVTDFGEEDKVPNFLYIFKRSLSLSLKQIKKLLNNEEFDQIIDEHKKDQQRLILNKQAIYNKF